MIIIILISSTRKRTKSIYLNTITINDKNNNNKIHDAFFANK